MIAASTVRGLRQPALTRLCALAPLDAPALAAVQGALANARSVRLRRELLTEGAPVGATKLIVNGWAARVRLLPDGRRQLLSFLLPGDLIGLCDHPSPVAVSTVVALTDLLICDAPCAHEFSILTQVYATSRALEEAYLLAHIARLGRMNAQERIVDLFLELFERLDLAGLVSDNGFDCPLTQETVADALGLTSVHVNRMVQLSRRDADLSWKAGRMTLSDPGRLAAKSGRTPVRVSDMSA